MSNKIIRTICYFADREYDFALEQLNRVTNILLQNGYNIQTRRICAKEDEISNVDLLSDDKTLLLGAGTISRKSALIQLDDIFNSGDVSFNFDLTDEIEIEDAEFLFKLIEGKAEKTFNFSYKFGDSPDTPYFPVATYKHDGFSLGLQPTDISENCSSIDEWLSETKNIWFELLSLFDQDDNFLGIDSSVAPLYEGKSSLVSMIKRFYGSFSDAVTTDVFLRISKYIKENNPAPVGLCGIMFPCLEDFELADEYEKGNFSVERNIFLSLHSGLGIDTYPIGVDESPSRVFDILKVLQAFSKKYNKPLSARFVSDGKARIGDKTDFRNQYMKDVVVRKL
jgi:hypothetical protein